MNDLTACQSWQAGSLRLIQAIVFSMSYCSCLFGMILVYW
jgi:hypothetical protein